MLHIDGKAAAAADKVHADAFAIGTHLFFAGGKYQPGTPGGDMLLLHELTHVAQYDHGQLRDSASGDLEVSKPGETAEMDAEGAALAGLVALRAADNNLPEDQVVSSDPFTEKVRGYDEDHEDLAREALTQKMQADGLYADDDDQVRGHVGAIYIGKDSERLSRPGGSHDFHTTIDGLWTFEKEPADFIKQVRAKLPKLLWDGDVKRFLSSDKEQLEPVAKAVPSRYHDRTNTSWGDDLGEVGDEALERRTNVTKALQVAAAGLPE